MRLYDKLYDYSQSDMLPLHMPGHKRKSTGGRLDDTLKIDITEIDGFDDLHHPTGIIRDMEERLAAIYGAKASYICVNGSTGANEAAILSVCSYGEKIILPRGSHKSVYYAIELAGLIPIYLEHEYMDAGHIGKPADVHSITEALRQHPDCKCVLITSPTYEGLIADVEAIASVAHSFGATLIVDSAHGAHLGVSDKLPGSAINLEADIAVVSLHKMLPSPTQTAAMLVGNSDIDLGKIQHYMSVFQSSSPSYILMAGIGECIEYMEHDAAGDIAELVSLSLEFQKEMQGLKFLKVNPIGGVDPFKLVVVTQLPTYTGKDLYEELLEKYHIQCEMYSLDYVLGMLGPVDKEDTFFRLGEALKSIDERLDSQNKLTDLTERFCEDIPFPKPQAACTISEAVRKEKEYISPDKAAVGRIAADYCMAYPPGIPLMVPGEIIDSNVITYIQNGLETGLNIIGLEEGLVSVIKQYE